MMMKTVISCSLALLALSTCVDGFSLRGDVLSMNQHTASADDDAPWFCHGLDCPKFKVKSTTDDYEVREYESADWVTTNVDSGFTVAMTKGFARLFEYISGANEDSKKLKMTAPVADCIITEEGFRKTADNYTISFYVPSDFQGQAPKPTSNDVKVVKGPAVTVYVSQFGGFATEQNLLKKAALLSETLKANGEDVETNFFIWTGYDPPYRLTGRHNEIWLFPKKSET